MAFDGPRDFLRFLDKKGVLARVSTPVDIVHEIAAYIRKSCDEEGPALYFEQVKGYDMPVVGGQFNSRERILEALGCSPDEAHDRFMGGIDNPIEPVGAAEAPCQEVVLEGAEVDLNRLPIPTYYSGEGGPYIVHGVHISKDPETGSRNAAIYVMQLKGRNRLGFEAAPFQDAYHQFMKAERQGQPLEIAVALGVDPVILLAAAAKVPYGLDELAVAGGLRGKPVEVVKCRTVDLEVPATSEIVFEGRVLPNHREPQGPFNEFCGYLAPVADKPIIEVTAVTHRASPVFHACLSGTPSSENDFLKQLSNEVSVYRELKAKFPEVKAVHFPTSASSEYHCYVSMTPRYKGQPKNVILATLGSAKRPKLVIVTDEDIDIFNDAKVLWALSTRFQADRDTVVVPSVSAAPEDPSSPEPSYSAVMGLDATRPFGEPFAEMPAVPGVKKTPDLWALVRKPKAAD